MCEIIDVEIWAFDANKNIPDKITPGIDFTAEEVNSIWCSSCNNIFVGTGNLQMITNKFWCEYL